MFLTLNQSVTKGYVSGFYYNHLQWDKKFDDPVIAVVLHIWHARGSKIYVSHAEQKKQTWEASPFDLHLSFL